MGLFFVLDLIGLEERNEDMTSHEHLMCALEQPTRQHQNIAKNEQIELKDGNPFKPKI